MSFQPPSWENLATAAQAVGWRGVRKVVKTVGFRHYSSNVDMTQRNGNARHRITGHKQQTPLKKTIIDQPSNLLLFDNIYIFTYYSLDDRWLRKKSKNTWKIQSQYEVTKSAFSKKYRK